MKPNGTINWPPEDGFVLKADGSADKTDINVPSDPQYVVAVRDGWVEYDWPENLGYQEGTVQSITRESGSPEQWDRYGHMGGGNFSDIPSDGPYTY